MEEKKIDVHMQFYPKLIKNLEKNDYALYNFNKKILVSEYREVYVNKSIPFYLDLSYCFIEIRMIVLRLNNDITNIKRMIEIHNLSLDRELTDEEADEDLSLSEYINYFDIDIASLFIWIKKFMDKLAKFLHSFMHGKRLPSNRGFNSFLNDLIKYKNEGLIKEKELDNIIRILSSYYTWWTDMKDIRDDYIIHHQKQSLPSASMGGEIVSGSFGTFKGKGKMISISNEYIDAQLLTLKSMLKDLNEFLCENIEVLPLK